MKIALDCDGVLYEFERTARYMERAYRGYAREGPMGKESTRWDYIKEHVKPEDWNWLWSVAVKLGLWRYGHVVQGALKGIQELTKAGHELIVITARPTNAIPDTVAWLNFIQKPEAGVFFTGIHILSNGEPKSIIKADVLVDDKPENVWEWMEAGRIAILFDRPWNRTPLATDAIVRARDWPDVVSIIEELEGGKGNPT